jgi:hypothetical protein
MPLLRILAGRDPTDPQCRALELGQPSTVQLGKLGILMFTSDGARPAVSPEITSAMNRAAATLCEQGARVEHRARMRSALLAYLGRLLEEGDWPFPLDSKTGRWSTVPTICEPIRLAGGRSEHILPVVATNILISPLRRLPKLIRRQPEAARALQSEIELAHASGRGARRDHRTMAVALALERSLGRWIPLSS